LGGGGGWGGGGGGGDGGLNQARRANVWMLFILMFLCQYLFVPF